MAKTTTETTAEGFIDVVDDARRCASDIGYWIKDVIAVRRVWPGPRVGDGLPEDISIDDDFTIDPRPRVEDASLTRIHERVGFIEQGSLLVTQISATISDEDIRGKFDDPLAERFWRVEKVADTREDTILEGPTGRFKATWYWRRPDPMGWQMLLVPIND